MAQWVGGGGGREGDLSTQDQLGKKALILVVWLIKSGRWMHADGVGKVTAAATSVFV